MHGQGLTQASGLRRSPIAVLPLHRISDPERVSALPVAHPPIPACLRPVCCLQSVEYACMLHSNANIQCIHRQGPTQASGLRWSNAPLLVYRTSDLERASALPLAHPPAACLLPPNLFLACYSTYTSAMFTSISC
jgi:hypothetical protein